jgi:16S rRNA (cytosine1402-N4)-methyltransferase
MHQNTKHTPVLLSEVLEYLEPKKGESYLDLTAGYGGHAQEVLNITQNYSDSVLVDRDENAILHLKSLFKGRGIEIIHDNFYDAAKKMREEGKGFDLVLADLGVSSPHLNEASRGFAFNQDGPLDMRMDQTQKLDAHKIVNTYSEKEIAAILKNFGEEPKAFQIARLIIENRPVTSTTQLANIVAKAWPGHSRVHPATRTFQALRIAVNQELDQLTRALPVLIECLSPGGRIAVISFHSLEDRVVKNIFSDLSGNKYDDVLKLLTKKPVESDKNELVFNPRARSAKLRAAAKINNRKGSSHANSGTKQLPRL